MGFVTSINLCLKVKLEQGLNEENLKVGKICNFLKDDYRIYPINLPVSFVNHK